MASILDPEYSQMLRRLVPFPDGPQKSAIDALQKQIEFHLGEIDRLRSAQNSHLPVFGLPVELLSEVFLYIVQSGITDGITSYAYRKWAKYGDPCFASGTFGFRQVCKHWNEVAVRSPQLWTQWAVGAIKAWPLFDERSKGASIILTWRPYLAAPGQHIPKVVVSPERIRQLDFVGSNQDFGNLIGSGNSSPLSPVSSIRLQIFSSKQDAEEHLVHFFSHSFPKLSKLDVQGFAPDPSSPAFVTSALTSLRLSFPDAVRSRYTLARFSRILQNHPNLQVLVLDDGAMPRVEPSEVPVPCSLLRLIDLKLTGSAERMVELMNLIGMASPLRNVTLCFRHPTDQRTSTLVEAVKKILIAYYECKGQKNSRKARYLTVQSNSTAPRDSGSLVFITGTTGLPSTSTSIRQPTLRLEFWRTNEFFDLFPLFPLKDVRTYTIDGLSLSLDRNRRMLQKVKQISHLHLAAVDIKPVLKAMDFDHANNTEKPGLPKMTSLTLSDVDLLYGVCDDLFSFLRKRNEKKTPVKKLIIQSCRVHSEDDLPDFGKVVKNVEYDDLEEVESDEESDSYSDDFEDMYYYGGSF